MTCPGEEGPQKAELRKNFVENPLSLPPLELKMTCPGEEGPQKTELRKKFVKKNFFYFFYPKFFSGAAKSGSAPGGTCPSYSTASGMGDHKFHSLVIIRTSGELW